MIRLAAPALLARRPARADAVPDDPDARCEGPCPSGSAGIHRRRAGGGPAGGRIARAAGPLRGAALTARLASLTLLSRRLALADAMPDDLGARVADGRAHPTARAFTAARETTRLTDALRATPARFGEQP